MAWFGPRIEPILPNDDKLTGCAIVAGHLITAFIDIFLCTRRLRTIVLVLGKDLAVLKLLEYKVLWIDSEGSRGVL